MSAGCGDRTVTTVNGVSVSWLPFPLALVVSPAHVYLKTICCSHYTHAIVQLQMGIEWYRHREQVWQDNELSMSWLHVYSLQNSSWLPSSSLCNKSCGINNTQSRPNDVFHSGARKKDWFPLLSAIAWNYLRAPTTSMPSEHVVSAASLFWNQILQTSWSDVPTCQLAMKRTLGAVFTNDDPCN